MKRTILRWYLPPHKIPFLESEGPAPLPGEGFYHHEHNLLYFVELRQFIEEKSCLYLDIYLTDKRPTIKTRTELLLL